MSILLAVALMLSLASLSLAAPFTVPVRRSSDFAATPVRPVENALPGPVVLVSYKPYEYGYELGDGLGMTQHRRESADGTGAVRGSYGYQDAIGVSRVVEYTADGDGYRAVVRTNEPGVVGQNPADATFVVQPPPAAAVGQGLIRRPVLLRSV